MQLARRAPARAAAAATAAALGFSALPLHAATPKDTLVLAMAFDDLISLDPAEAFEISAGEMLGSRLARFR